MPRRIACLILLPVLFVGCGGPPPMGTVAGVVTVDGKPIADVEVQFLPDPAQSTNGAAARSYTNEQGRFTLRTDKHSADGALVGTHRVIFVDITALHVPPPEREDPAAPQPKGAPKAEQSKRSRVPVEYSDPNRTPYRTVEVKPGDQTLNFDLKSTQR